ncbi:peptidase M17 [Labilibaculum filiforme]|uniref:Probable cytosol aminopeptidase n=1 Tax=Labilibaculum filiforme TaxID=1940526 RepID=A0A2N3HXC4_9BACT|nr:leucyl aminopeptidase [Labilibaculum filiforme]PKQ62726.1 peptidase M17 [Labilibaculum filiforme]
MKIEVKSNQKLNKNDNVLFLATSENYKNLPLSEQEMKFVDAQIADEVLLIELNRYTQKLYLHVTDTKKFADSDLEKMRKLGFSLHGKIQESKITKIVLQDMLNDLEAILALTEGIALSNYQFLKYFTDTKKLKHTLQEVFIDSSVVGQNHVDELIAIVEGVRFARELVNEPLSYLTAEKLSEEIRTMGSKAGFSVEVFGKKKIESLKMGGLLAVNKGSIDEPTFSILEWKSKDAVNAKPIVFVGKGVVYDTGGLSLKPTKDSMDLMKSDMGGAASVAGAIYAIAKAKLPIHVIGLIPATDNRPGGNAYVPGDVVEMYNGKTVEVLNTDAEGRMLLADALSYADMYKPEFVVDLATLTGAAAVAIGQYGMVAMGNDASKDKMIQLKVSGEKVYERLVEFPFWEEFGELIKSDIADLKNLGGRDGGAITAGKFLEHFTNYPWIHLDIAGPAFISATDNYRGKGGTGVGVRLLFEFIKQYRS